MPGCPAAAGCAAGPTAVAVEGKRAVASCPSGQVIKSVANVFYGKHSAGCVARTSYRRALGELWRAGRCCPVQAEPAGNMLVPSDIVRAAAPGMGKVRPSQQPSCPGPPCRVVAGSCVGKAVCAPLANDLVFGGDPCPRVKPKVLWFQYR